MTSNKKNGNTVMTILFLFISICSILGTIAFVMNFTSQPGSENYIEQLENSKEQLENAKEQLREISSKENYFGDAAVAKTAAIKNIRKALTDAGATTEQMGRIMPHLEGGPLVEVARKMKAVEGMQPQINDMERRLGIMQSVEPVLENAIKTLQKVVDVRGMG